MCLLRRCYVAENPSGGIPEAFGSIIKRIRNDKNIGRMIIFCRTYEAVTSIFYYFKTELREYYTKPMGSPNYVQYRVVHMYTHCTHASVRNKIQQYFTTPSPLKIVIAIIAFGLGVNCPNVRQTGVCQKTVKHMFKKVVELVGMGSLLVLFYVLNTFLLIKRYISYTYHY